MCVRVCLWLNYLENRPRCHVKMHQVYCPGPMDRAALIVSESFVVVRLAVSRQVLNINVFAANPHCINASRQALHPTGITQMFVNVRQRK